MSEAKVACGFTDAQCPICGMTATARGSFSGDPLALIGYYGCYHLQGAVSIGDKIAFFFQE